MGSSLSKVSQNGLACANLIAAETMDVRKTAFKALALQCSV